ncbi:hypothetical protein ANN_24454 [Periplaneta americana]|uniref:Uncharacterized protein n=1 Tax=Periplaneta americana TaxID=6978 RepID=A0ABQ8S3E9_PERAM|nr:hypothetical protein ANN_24454 [Periplaneta americana]
MGMACSRVIIRNDTLFQRGRILGWLLLAYIDVTEAMGSKVQHCDRKGQPVCAAPENEHKRELRDIYKDPDIIALIKSRRLRWLGHVLPQYEDSLLRKASDYSPRCTKPLGRPHLRWHSTLGGRQEDAENRDEWRYINSNKDIKYQYKDYDMDNDKDHDKYHDMNHDKVHDKGHNMDHVKDQGENHDNNYDKGLHDEGNKDHDKVNKDHGRNHRING